VTQRSLLDVFAPQRLLQEWVVLEVQHPKAKIEAGAPVSIDLAQLFAAERPP
jgi:hypothetical protein